MNLSDEDEDTITHIRWIFRFLQLFMEGHNL